MPIPKGDYLSDVWRDKLFDKRVVFCTGGGGTICSAQVRALVHLGANACIVGRSVERTERMAADIESARPGARVLGLGGVDVRDTLSLDKAVEKCVKELGSLDYVIAGAAGNFLAPIDQLSANAFKTVIEIDVIGSYNTLKATLLQLLKSATAHRLHSTTSPGGRIVFLSATTQYTGAPMQAHAAVAKAGIDALSASVAIEMGPRGITSNVIAPGPINCTEGLERLVTDPDNPTHTKGVPVGRFGTVRDLADAIVYLFSDAGSYVNGEIMVVDGGAWRTGQCRPGGEFQYPDFLLSGERVRAIMAEKAAPKI